MTYKAELDFARQAADAYQSAHAWLWQSHLATQRQEHDRAERCRATAKRYCYEARLARARADAISERRIGGKVSYDTQHEIDHVSRLMEAAL